METTRLGQIGVPNVVTNSRGRSPHYCRIPIERFHQLLRSRGWAFAGEMWAEKEIAGRGVLMFVDREEGEYAVCKLMLFDDYWKMCRGAISEARAVRRRLAFEVVDKAGRRHARKSLPCATLLLQQFELQARSEGIPARISEPEKQPKS